MKIRYRLAAIASAVALAGAGALAGQGVASADTALPFNLNWDNPTLCIGTDGTGNPVSLGGAGTCANFLSENGVHTNGHDYVEYRHNGTNGCLTDSGATVYIQTCTPNDNRQMWYYNVSAGVGYVENLYATLHYGHSDVMTASGATVIVADNTSDIYTQYWNRN
jgi:hypothetical protein